MFTRKLLLLVIFSLISFNLAHAVGAKSASTAIKVIGEALEEAKAVQAASKSEKAAQVVKEANAAEKPHSHISTTQVLFATNQIVRECERAKRNSDKNWCSLQKNKINTCLEARLKSGFVIEGAVKQCSAEIN